MHERDEHQLREKLLKAGVLGEVQMRVVEDYQASVGGSVRDIVVRLGFARQEEVARVLAAAPPLVVDREHIANDYASKLPVKLLQGYCVLPVHSPQGITLACEYELEPIVREEIWDLLGVKLPVTLVPSGTVKAVLEALSRSRVVRKPPAPAAMAPVAPPHIPAEPVRPAVSYTGTSADAPSAPSASARTAPPHAPVTPGRAPSPAATHPSPGEATHAAVAREPRQTSPQSHPQVEPPRTVIPQPLPELGVRELCAFLIAKGVITESDLRAFAAACQSLGPSIGK